MSIATTREAARSSVRVVGISDVMIMVAATAVGIFLSMTWNHALDTELATFKLAGWPTASRTRFSGYALSVLIPATLAVLAIRFRSRRPRLWLLARQPGTMACISAVIALAGQMLAMPLDLHTMGGYTSPLLVAAFYWPPAISCAVLAPWVILALIRHWRTDGDWVERWGVLVGVCWVGLLPWLLVIELRLG